MGHPYIASLWLGSLALKRSCLNGLLRRSLALFVARLPPSFWNRLTKGSKGPFVILYAHSRVWMGSMIYKAFCLVYHGSRSNNHKHIFVSAPNTGYLGSAWTLTLIQCFDVKKMNIETQCNQCFNVDLNVSMLQFFQILPKLKKAENCPE